MKKIFLVVALVLSAFGADDLTNGWLDTLSIHGVTGTGTVFYSDSVHRLNTMEDIRFIMRADDTTSVRLGNDSVSIAWGYQVGSFTLGSGGAKDTIWEESGIIALDTIYIDSIADATANIPPVVEMDGTGAFTMLKGYVDTTTGWIAQSAWFAPEPARLIRPWAKGITGNKAGEELRISVQVERRIALPVRAK